MSELPPRPKLGAWRWVVWAGSVVLFAVGGWVGPTSSPTLGILCWAASGVLAFVPFLAHRVYLEEPPAGRTSDD